MGKRMESFTRSDVVMMLLLVGWLPFVPRKSRILLNQDDAEGSGALVIKE
jgi:hypothetical protein